MEQRKGILGEAAVIGGMRFENVVVLVVILLELHFGVLAEQLVDGVSISVEAGCYQ